MRPVSSLISLLFAIFDLSLYGTVVPPGNMNKKISANNFLNPFFINVKKVKDTVPSDRNEETEENDPQAYDPQAASKASFLQEP